METIITILIDIAIVVFIMRMVSRKAVTSQLNLVKKDPKKYLKDNIDDSVINKEGLLKEIEKIDKVMKVDYWGWIKQSFNNPSYKKEGITKMEAKVKRTDGQEIWYKFTMKKKKLLSIEETYKPIT